MTFTPRAVCNRAGWLVLAIALLSGCGTADAQKNTSKIDGDKLLDPNRVIEVRLELAADDWSKLCRQSRDPAAAFSGLPTEDPYSYFKADLWIDGTKIQSVGVRKKGFLGSGDFERPSLKIKFDEYEQQDPIKGLSRLTLNNNKQDRSQVSQFLAYNLFRDAGNPAPRSNWAHVVVNGESLGVYSHVESIKKPFLQRSFGDKTGNLYEGTLTDFHPQALVNVEVKTNEMENELNDIKRLANLLAEDGELDLEQLDQLIDVESFLRFWALESLIGFWDGYSANQNNYYLYFNPKDGGRAAFIPWGADWVFTNGGPFSRGRFGGGDGDATVAYGQSILANRLYHTAGIPERYQATMQRLLDEVWDEDKMLAEIDRVEKLVTPHLHRAQSETPQAMDEIRQFIRNRGDVVRRQLRDWRPDVPAEPRTPSHFIDLGHAKGSFTTRFGGNQAAAAESSQAELQIQLDGKPIELTKVEVRAERFQFPRFGPPGGFGGPPRGFAGPGGPAPPAPVNLVFTGTRGEGEPITITMMIDAEKFARDGGDPIKVTGSYQEGQRGGGFPGFGGFGGGPNRSVIGELALEKSGTNEGDAVAGSVDLQVVETRGGLFQPPQRRGGDSPRRGGFGPPGGFPPAAGPPPMRAPAGPFAGGVPPSITLWSALDEDRDGTISSQEIEQSASALKRLDRNGDGKLSGEELQPRPDSQQRN